MVACSKKETCTDVNYNTDFEVVLNDEICFPDGRSLLIDEFRDEFCPCAVTCVWEGQLVVVATVTHPNGESEILHLPSTDGAWALDLSSEHKIDITTFTHDGEFYLDCENEVPFDADKVVVRIMTESI